MKQTCEIFKIVLINLFEIFISENRNLFIGTKAVVLPPRTLLSNDVTYFKLTYFMMKYMFGNQIFPDSI